MTVSTTEKKFGNSSFYFNGSSNFLNITNTNLPAVNSTFTVDMWIYPVSTNGGVLISIANHGSNSALRGGVVWISSIGAGYYSSAHIINQTGLNNPINTWHHIAFIYDGTVTKIYINGIALASTYTYTFSSMEWRTKTVIGANYLGVNTLQLFGGYIDELRISNIARWTENFTPPTEQYN